MSEQEYVRAIRELYRRLPHTQPRFSRADRALACELYCRGIPLDAVRSALLLASARRIYRDPAAAPLGDIRSLHYFLPVIHEISQRPLPNGYLKYLEYKLATIK